MNIGFDAKRYFHNNTGLGNYSRTLVDTLAQAYPQHQYLLFNPKKGNRYSKGDLSNLQEVLPRDFVSKKLSALWRSRWITKDLVQHKIDLYHGLSHELPLGISRAGIASVVTVHDLIFERYPKQYGSYEVWMHRRKIRHACAHANRVIAVSEQTKSDLIELYRIDGTKIDVCYQSCNPRFMQPAAESLKGAVRAAYSLPRHFFLYVGSVTERKNLLRICEAMHQAGSDLHSPLVVVGEGKKYLQTVQDFIQQAGLQHKVLFLSGRDVSPELSIHKVENLAALYQSASGFIYPSLFEGFGIPVLEALWSGVPVITSSTSCLPETGGNAALYVQPESAASIAEAMLQLQENETLRSNMVANGYAHAQKFSPQRCAASVMEVYQKIMGNAIIR